MVNNMYWSNKNHIQAQVKHDGQVFDQFSTIKFCTRRNIHFFANSLKGIAVLNISKIEQENIKL